MTVSYSVPVRAASIARWAAATSCVPSPFARSSHPNQSCGIGRNEVDADPRAAASRRDRHDRGGELTACAPFHRVERFAHLSLQPDLSTRDVEQLSDRGSRNLAVEPALEPERGRRPERRGLWRRASVRDFDGGSGHVRGRNSHLRRDLLDLGEREASIGLRGETFLTLCCPAKDLAELEFGEPLTPA